MPVNTTPQAIVALLALGMALAFIIADRNAPTSRAAALFLAAVGLSIGLGSQVDYPLRLKVGVQWWSGLFAIPETFAFIFAYEWILRVRRTVPARNLRTGPADVQLRVAQVLALVYLAASIALPQERAQFFQNVEVGTRPLGIPVFWVFAGPLLLSLLLGIASALLVLNRRPDRAESIRLLSFAIAAPFMSSGLVLPLEMAPVATAVGLLIFLVGAVQYHVVQGSRAQFMSRFLSPQVAELVREQGLKSATQEKTLEISVVCCDLRGFTAFSAATSSREVIAILREYYDTVGAAAAQVGGTIKDQAGDGVLILIGAPIGFEDHARRALDLARSIRTEGMALAARWSGGERQLGVGVGVASGFVTVGVIGGASRLEYTAVGPSVNLSSRLCSEAAHGEVLVDGRTVELVAQDASLRAGEPLRLKGFAELVPSWTLLPAL
ncbi:MAG: adenylate/guanylate cyclase domain-containing protein [Proteobacteria bacterium]|nr:adenylate/guanylate cyclase domain-containing protein [Pseudomonadota bacterium]